jgi:outer membrane lipoprotein SlyB
MDIVIGIVGAIIGGWIMRALGFQGQGGMIYTILVAIGGAVVLTWLYRLVAGRRGVSRGGPNQIDERGDKTNLRKVA